MTGTINLAKNPWWRATGSKGKTYYSAKSNCPLNSCLWTHRSVQLPDLIREVSFCSGYQLAQKLITDQCTENKYSVEGSRHKWGIYITCSGLSWKREWKDFKSQRLERSKIVSSGHGRTTTLMNSEQLWLSIQNQACKHSSMEWAGEYKPPTPDWGINDKWWLLGEESV